MSETRNLGPRIRDNNDGTICVEYTPTAEGRHEVLMAHNGSAIRGKYNVNVYISICLYIYVCS